MNFLSWSLMVSKMRKNLFFVLIAIISIGIITLNTSNTLKYLMCENPANYIYTDLVVEEDSVTITFDSPTSNEVFSDYEYHIEDNTLYIGVRYSMVIIGNESSSRKTVTIELDEEVDKIVLKGNNEEVIIYP